MYLSEGSRPYAIRDCGNHRTDRTVKMPLYYIYFLISLFYTFQILIYVTMHFFLSNLSEALILLDSFCQKFMAICPKKIG